MIDRIPVPKRHTGPESPQLSERPALEALLRQSQRLIEMDDEIRFAKFEERELSEALQQEHAECTASITAGLPTLARSLVHFEDMDVVRQIIYELNVVIPFNTQLAFLISDAAGYLLRDVRNFSEHFELILQLLSEAKSHLSDADGGAVDAERQNASAKIDRAVLAHFDYITTFFDIGANPPTDEQWSDRLKGMSYLSRLLPREKDEWMLSTLVSYASACIDEGTFEKLTSWDQLTRDLAAITALRAGADAGAGKTKMDAGDLIRMSAHWTESQQIKLVEALLQRYGLPGGDMCRAAVSYADVNQPIVFQYYFRQCLDQVAMIARLENGHPGSVRYLHENFGLRWLQRYPTEVLIDMYENRDDTTSPQFLIVTGESDWNSAFINEGSVELVASVYRQLKAIAHQGGPTFRVRLAEVGTNKNFVSVGERIGAKYPPAEYMLLRSHGHPTRIATGDGDDDDIQAADVEKKKEWFTKAMSCVSESATIILDACGVGRKRGMASVLSRVYKRVIAPKGISVEMARLDISPGTDESLTIQAKYQINEKSQDVPAHVYIGGRRR